MDNNKIFIIVFVLLLLLGVIIFLFSYFNTKSSSSNNNNLSTFNDDSDCPQPPSTLEYNRSLSPPKRNRNIVNACSSGLPCKKYDKFNGSYYSMLEDVPL